MKIYRFFVVFILCFFFGFQYAYAGPSVFKLIFHNNGHNKITIKQQKTFNTKGFKRKSDSVLPGKPSHVFVVKQDKTYSNRNNILAMSNSWIVTQYDQNKQVVCSSLMTFQLAHFNIGEWRYGILFNKRSDVKECLHFISSSSLDFSGNPLGNKKLPRAKKKGQTRTYTINIALGGKN